MNKTAMKAASIDWKSIKPFNLNGKNVRHPVNFFNFHCERIHDKGSKESEKILIEAMDIVLK